jgi:ligand-binding SRPBCC domain-containing protein
MKLRTLHFSQVLPCRRDDLFPFFAAAENLERITPPWLNFRILSPSPVLMQKGRLIDYSLRLHGLPLRWRSEISTWEPPHRFVDTQVRGPYRQWVHTHTFTEVAGGTLCEDDVNYAVPGGRWVDTIFVRPQLTRIFAYRQKVLQQVFAKESIQAPPSTVPSHLRAETTRDALQCPLARSTP